MFVERLSKLCAENGVRITNVIKELNLAKGSVSKWRTGVMPNSETLIKLAEYFKVSADYILGLSDDPTPPNQKSTTEKADEAKVAEILVKMREGNPNRAVIMKYGGDKPYVIDLSDEELEQVDLILEVMREKKKREEENNKQK